MGLGGSGIKKQAEVDGEKQIVSRSEQPGMMHFYMDKVISGDMTLGFEHSRGFTLSPFASGVGFTGVNLRWHYMGPPPEVTPVAAAQSHLFLKRWSPYTGGSTGIAFGSIDREGELIKNIAASGVFLGLKNGVEYQWRPDMATRFEISYSYTFSKTELVPSSMSEFSLWSGIIIPLFRD